MTLKTILLGACSVLALAGMASAETLTIATVNNGDMVRMQGLTSEFTSKNPDITVEWVTLEETSCVNASQPTWPPRAANTTS